MADTEDVLRELKLIVSLGSWATYADKLRTIRKAAALIRELQAEIKRKDAALDEALEFAEGYEDVVDGSYGEPRPNLAMQVATRIRTALSPPRQEE